MEKEVRGMLEDMYAVLNEKYNDPIKSWDSLIELIAIDNCAALIFQINHKLQWIYQDRKLADEIKNTYDSELLRSDFYDHLGEMYLEKIVSKEGAKEGIYLTPMNYVNKRAQMLIEKTKMKLKILDPTARTGRQLMASYKRAPNSLFFGADTDLRALRIAFTNLAIHGIKGYLLHADCFKHELDLANDDGWYNWQYSNKWYSCMDKLKPIAKANKAISRTKGLLN